jgi:pimeloyl-ACP methyl ester carboxylesterase
MPVSSTKPRERDLPVAFRALRAALGLTSRVSPELAGHWANRLWFRSQRFPEPAREREWLASAQWMTLSRRDRSLAVYHWGEGPTVLLMHGWNGRGAQLGAFAQPLAQAGFRVVAFDAPAHGRTPGRDTNLPEVSEALLEVATKFAPLHGVIAHSFGVPCTLYAIAHGLAPRRVVALSPPSRIEFLMDSFAAGLALSEPVKAVHRRLMEKRFGADVWQRFAPNGLASEIDIPALLIHDDQDDDVPLREGEALARAWPRSEFMRTSGLGHRRILRDPAVIERTATFLGD